MFELPNEVKTVLEAAELDLDWQEHPGGIYTSKGETWWRVIYGRWTIVTWRSSGAIVQASLPEHYDIEDVQDVAFHLCASLPSKQVPEAVARFARAIGLL